jgi:hypothetical protein
MQLMKGAATASEPAEKPAKIFQEKVPFFTKILTSAIHEPQAQRSKNK